jgi:hypothetical protein
MLHPVEEVVGEMGLPGGVGPFAKGQPGTHDRAQQEAYADAYQQAGDKAGVPTLSSRKDRRGVHAESVWDEP